MVLPLAAAAARRRFANVASRQIQKPSMGSGPAPEWTGIDKVVRDVFPGDHQLAVAILGGYVGLYALVKMVSAVRGGKKVEEVPAPASSGVAIASTGIPPVDSPEFDKYLETDAFYKMLESEEQLGKVVADMK